MDISNLSVVIIIITTNIHAFSQNKPVKFQLIKTEQ